MESAVEYDPEKYYRGDVTPRVSALTEAEEDGIGYVMPEKSPTATLRIFGSNYGSQWLTYPLAGGRQDEGKSPTWFFFYYVGIVMVGGEETFGHWRVLVEGENVEVICYQIGKQICAKLGVGTRPNSKPPIVVSKITFQAFKPKKAKVDGAEDEEE